MTQRAPVDMWEELHGPPEYEVVMRLVVTRRVKGAVPQQRRHKILTNLKHLIGLVANKRIYTIDVAEVADVRKVE